MESQFEESWESPEPEESTALVRPGREPDIVALAEELVSSAMMTGSTVTAAVLPAMAETGRTAARTAAVSAMVLFI